MLKSNKIYLDYASGASPNPSSIHASGVKAKKKLEDARTKVARILGARPDEIIFTSGGTESNNLAIQGIISVSFSHIVTTNIEHVSVLETCRMLERRGLAKVSIVPVERNGIVDPKKIKNAMRENTALVSVMCANNEIGTIQPIREIAKEIRHWKKEKRKDFPFFHVDAVQASNYLDLDTARLGAGMMSISGSKIPGSGGAGALYKKREISLRPIMAGGDQEMGLRPGTENVEAIVQFADAFELAQKIKDKEFKRLEKLRDYFFTELEKVSKRHFDIKKNGDLKNRLPNNINITVKNIPSDLLVIELSEKGIMVSGKSACRAKDGKVSHVLQAIDKNIKKEDGAVRFSLGSDTTKKDIDTAIKVLSEILTKLKKWYISTPVKVEMK